MSIRLNKVARDLNVGIQTAVEFLQKKGFSVEPNPNTKITDEQYALLVKEFSKDKNLKQESDNISLERHTKEKNRATQPKVMCLLTILSYRNLMRLKWSCLRNVNLRS